MPAQLLALDGGPSILLDKPILLLGRHPECDIQIESRKISRRHCCIAHVNDYLVVRDLGSTNGIRINGDRVNEGRLDEGDELTLGSHRYRVTWRDVPEPPPRPAPALATQPSPQRPPDPGEDDMLEECEDPVPLAEPGGPRPAPPRAADPPPPERPKPSSRILPEHLELAPSGDAFPNLPSHQPGSHPPA
jgi:predicted component of type VI protein secretion system